MEIYDAPELSRYRTALGVIKEYHLPVKLTHTHTPHTHARARTRTHTRTHAHTWEHAKIIAQTKIRQRIKGRSETLLKEVSFQSLSKWLRARMTEMYGRSLQVEGQTCENDFWPNALELELSVKMEKFKAVLWSNACDYTEAKHGNFKLFSCPDSQPV